MSLPQRAAHCFLRQSQIWFSLNQGGKKGLRNAPAGSNAGQAVLSHLHQHCLTTANPWRWGDRRSRGFGASSRDAAVPCDPPEQHGS